jgi:hypothetical protein
VTLILAGWPFGRACDGQAVRKRTVSLGIRQIRVPDRPDLGIRRTASDRHGLCGTGANGPPMARGLIAPPGPCLEAWSVIVSVDARSVSPCGVGGHARSLSALARNCGDVSACAHAASAWSGSWAARRLSRSSRSTS